MTPEAIIITAFVAVGALTALASQISIWRAADRDAAAREAARKARRLAELAPLDSYWREVKR